MNTHEITKLGRRLITEHLAFHGVFAADTFIEALSFTNNSTAAYIVNTEQSHLPGRHWVAIIQEPGGRFEFFDPQTWTLGVRKLKHIQLGGIQLA